MGSGYSNDGSGFQTIFDTVQNQDVVYFSHIFKDLWEETI